MSVPGMRACVWGGGTETDRQREKETEIAAKALPGIWLPCRVNRKKRQLELNS